MTGWLGWTPEVTLDTPIQQIMLAMEGKVDFLKKTIGSGEEDKDEDLMNKPADPAGAARKLVAFVEATRKKEAIKTKLAEDRKARLANG